MNSWTKGLSIDAGLSRASLYDGRISYQKATRIKYAHKTRNFCKDVDLGCRCWIKAVAITPAPTPIHFVDSRGHADLSMRSIGIAISSGRSIYIFDAEVGKSLVCIDDTVDPPSAQTSCSLCVSNPPPDSMMGPLVVMGTHDGRVIVRDLLSSGVLFDELSKVKLFSGPVRAVAIHDDPNSRHAKRVNNNMFEQKFRSMILAACGNEVHIWATEGGVDKVAVLTDHEHPVNAISLCFRPPRTSFADSTTTSGRSPTTSRGAKISDHASFIVTAASDARVLVYDMKSFALYHALSGHEGGVLCLSTLGMKVSRRQCQSKPQSQHNNIDDLRGQRGTEEKEQQPQNSDGGGASPSHSHSSPVDRREEEQEQQEEVVVMYAVTGGFDKTVRVWDLDTGSLVKTLRGHTGAVNCVACIPSRRPGIVSGGVEGSIIIWCLETGTQLGRIDSAHSEQVKSVSVTLRPRMLIVSGGYDGKTKVWDLSMSEDKQLAGVVEVLNPKIAERKACMSVAESAEEKGECEG